MTDIFTAVAGAINIGRIIYGVYAKTSHKHKKSYALSYVTKSGKRKLFIIPFDTRVLIGQSELADIRPEDSKVAHEHCSIRWVKNGVYVRHLRSSYKTSVNDRRIEGKNKAKWLRLGDTLCCGKTEFRLVIYEYSH